VLVVRETWMSRKRIDIEERHGRVCIVVIVYCEQFVERCNFRDFKSGVLNRFCAG